MCFAEIIEKQARVNAPNHKEKFRNYPGLNPEPHFCAFRT